MPPRTQAFVSPQFKAASVQSSALKRARKLGGGPIAKRILGVDPGLHRTGYGVIETQHDTLTIIEGGILKARPTDDFALRLQTLYDGLREVLEEHQPEVVVIEELFSTYAHPKSALLMAHARGVLMLAAQQANARVHGFAPNEVKQVLTGHGHATKPEVQSAVRARLKLNAPLNPPDVADALALALCFALRQEISANLEQ